MAKKFLALICMCLMAGSALGQSFYRVDESRYNYPPNFEVYRYPGLIDIDMAYDPANMLLFIPTYNNWNDPWDQNEPFYGGFNGWGMLGGFDPRLAGRWLEANYRGGPYPVHNPYG